ncbi:DUF6530 family protein [Paenibacillus taichungensis]
MKETVAPEHKPVVVAEHYEKVDGRLASNLGAKGLSLGLTQWGDRGKVNISAKTWENTGEKCSMQSEELPLHRVFDLSILICKSLEYFQEAYRHEHLYDPQEPVIDRIALQGNAMTVGVCIDDESINENIELFSQALQDNDEMNSERLRALAKILKDMGY